MLVHDTRTFAIVGLKFKEIVLEASGAWLVEVLIASSKLAVVPCYHIPFLFPFFPWHMPSIHEFVSLTASSVDGIYGQCQRSAYWTRNKG